MSRHYVLGDDCRTPKEVTIAELRSLQELVYHASREHQRIPSPGDSWARVAWNELVDKKVRISTVFLGLDHNWNDDGPPLVFETMIFGGAESGWIKRYSTWDEALEGHAEAVVLAMNSVGELPNQTTCQCTKSDHWREDELGNEVRLSCGCFCSDCEQF